MFFFTVVTPGMLTSNRQLLSVADLGRSFVSLWFLSVLASKLQNGSLKLATLLPGMLYW